MSVKKVFLGEKNGNFLGKMFCIVLKDAEEARRVMFRGNLSNLLILFGSIPFVFFSILSIFSLNNFLNYNIIYLASLYVLTIVSFICGTHWGIFLSSKKITINLFIISNLLTLLVYFGFLILSSFAFILLSILIFIVLLFVDFFIFKNDVIVSNYLKVRFYVSLIVLISLFVLLFNSF